MQKMYSVHLVLVWPSRLYFTAQERQIDTEHKVYLMKGMNKRYGDKHEEYRHGNMTKNRT